VWLDAAATLAREPQLSPDALRASGRYHDALTDDARLVLAVVRAAADAGAVAANYAEAIDLAAEGGSVVGVHVRPRLEDGEPFLLCAPVVVNAIGVWLTAPYAAGVPARPLRPTKGIHIFVPRDRVGNREAVVLTSPRDGRMLFVLPWGRLALVGTTDTDHRGDLNAPVPEAADVDYLLDAVNATFPFARLARADVVSAYAGLRPLLGSTATRESDVSREHEIFESPDGLLSIAGGKLTGFRPMAQETLERAAEIHGLRLAAAAPPLPLPGGDFDGDLDALASRLTRERALPPATARRHPVAPPLPAGQACCVRSPRPSRRSSTCRDQCAMWFTSSQMEWASGDGFQVAASTLMPASILDRPGWPQLPRPAVSFMKTATSLASTLRCDGPAILPQTPPCASLCGGMSFCAPIGHPSHGGEGQEASYSKEYHYVWS